MAVAGEILVLPFFGQGHLLPSIELCKHLSSRYFKITLIISSAQSSSMPTTLPNSYPLVQIAEIAGTAASPPPPHEILGRGPPSGNPFGRQNEEMGKGIKSLLLGRPDGSPRPVCAVIDTMMIWSKEIFSEFGIPSIAFFTSGACSAAMEYSSWKARVDELNPGETRSLPGLPDDVALSYSDLQRSPHHVGHGGRRSRPPPMGHGFQPGGLPSFGLGGPPPFGLGGPPPFGLDGPPFGLGGLPPFGLGGPPPFGLGGPPHFELGGPPPFGPPYSMNPRRRKSDGPPNSMNPCRRKFHGPPKVGEEPMWVKEMEDTIAFMMNTCHELEGPFLDYVGQQMGKPVWGVGPLLPEQYWNYTGSILSDRDMRPNKLSSHSEEEVIQWLDAKPEGSVLYVSFGSEVGPVVKEYAELESALEESNKSFIWVVRPGSGKPGPPGGDPGYNPNGLEAKVGERGLIIHGWAPQLLILSHPSTGGFLTHGGWNSTMEAIGRGVPMLVWPIRGDQFFNLKLVVSHLKTGHNIKEAGMAEMVVKDDIMKGIDRLMADQGAKTRAVSIGKKFESGFPATSKAALDAFRDFIVAKTR